MVIRVGMHEAKTKLSQLVVAAERGQEVMIERRGIPVARLVPVEAPKRTRASFCGSMPDLWIADDFDELPEEFVEAFGMR
jgi:prevent-host-death family protein